LKLHPDMFKDADPNALIERAYDIQVVGLPMEERSRSRMATKPAESPDAVPG
jgi:hypothetical protein